MPLLAAQARTAALSTLVSTWAAVRQPLCRALDCADVGGDGSLDGHGRQDRCASGHHDPWVREGA
jgi:hypothetical protein